MYVRFTIPSDGERTPTGSAAGIFRAAGRLRDAYRLDNWQHQLLEEDFDWVNVRHAAPFDGVGEGESLAAPVAEAVESAAS